MRRNSVKSVFASLLTFDYHLNSFSGMVYLNWFLLIKTVFAYLYKQWFSNTGIGEQHCFPYEKGSSQVKSITKLQNADTCIFGIADARIAKQSNLHKIQAISRTIKIKESEE